VAWRFNRTIFQHTRVELRCSGGIPVATANPQGSNFPSHRVWVDDVDGLTVTTTPQHKMRDLWLLPPTPVAAGSCSCNDSSCVCDGVAAPGSGDPNECNCSGTDLDGYGVTSKECGSTVCAQDFQVWACTNNNYQPTGEACGGGSDNGGGDNGGDPSGCDCVGTNQDGGDASTKECGATVCSEDYQIWVCTSGGYEPTGTGC
jgi:hypothetical protein